MTTLVLGPSLGTSAATLWSDCTAHLPADLDVVAWDLPGHGRNRGPAVGGLTIQDLARHVLDQVEGDFVYAGDSVGGAVGLQLALDAPDRVLALVVISSAARVGTREGWHERRELVERAGTSVMVGPSSERWFAPGFLEREPARGSALLHALADTDAAGYAAVCGALADFDVRDRLAEITTPVLAVAGAADIVIPVADVQAVADGVQDGRCVVLADVGHLPPAEDPQTVARLIAEHCTTTTRRTA